MRIKPPHHAITRRRRAGLSLLELMLALVGTAFIATAVAAMLDAVAYGATTGQHLRDLVPRHRMLSGRLTDTLASSERILTTSATTVVLWRQDRNNDGITDTDELAWLTYSASNDLLTYQEALESSTSIPLPTLPDYTLIRLGLSFLNKLDTTVFARDLSAFSITGNTAAPNTTLLTWRATFTIGSITDTQVYATRVGG